jgi:hypothetical protein
MARFHAVTWEDGNFGRTAVVLSFRNKAARAAYPAQSPQRVENIDYARKETLLREGRMHKLLLWDASDPAKFVVA